MKKTGKKAFSLEFSMLFKNEKKSKEYHKAGSGAAQQYDHSEGRVRNVPSSWVVNGKEVESHPKLLPELNVVSESSLGCH